MRWVWCEFRETEDAEPDWSKVPEGRRKLVKDRWDSAHVQVSRWLLWEPQIPLLSKMEGTTITVIGPKEENDV